MFVKTMRAIFYLLSFLLLVSCAVPQKEFPPGQTLEGVETILIMSFQNLYAVYGDGTNVDCAVCNRRHVIEKVPPGVTEFMTKQMINLLKNERAYRFVFPEQTDKSLFNLQADKNGVVKMTELVATSAGTNTVDAILTGHLFHFKERVGTAYSVESPASVAFSLFLIRVTDGRVLWRGIFEETQQSLLENILKIGSFFKRKARWVTAREMAAEGLENLISTFPKP